MIYAAATGDDEVNDRGAVALNMAVLRAHFSVPTHYCAAGCI